MGTPGWKYLTTWATQGECQIDLRLAPTARRRAGTLHSGTCLYGVLTSTIRDSVNPLMVLSTIGVVYMVLTSNQRDHVVLNLSLAGAGPQRFGSDWSASVTMRRERAR